MKYTQKELDLENIVTKKQGGRYLLGMLQNLFCSCQSEISAFLLFNFQCSVLQKSNCKVAEILQNCAKAHLNNSRLLSKTILEYRGLPFYINSQNAPLNAFWLDPETNLEKIKTLDKNFLKTLIKNYENYIKKISDKKVLKILKFLKERNVQILNNLSFI